MSARRIGRCPQRTVTDASTGQQDWVVLLEATPGKAGTSPMDVETARALLRAMGDVDAIALQCPDRVGLQVRLTAADPMMALHRAFTRWRAVAGSVGTGWTVVRAEILTFPEFERDVEGGPA
jgi:hypothetical protein